MPCAVTSLSTHVELLRLPCCCCTLLLCVRVSTLLLSVFACCLLLLDAGVLECRCPLRRQGVLQLPREQIQEFISHFTEYIYESPLC